MHEENAKNAQGRREKTWDECTETEKTERMRGVVKQLQRSNQRLRTEVTELKEAARRHQHAQDGSVLVPVGNMSHCESDGPSKNDEWF